MRWCCEDRASTTTMHQLCRRTAHRSRRPTLTTLVSLSFGKTLTSLSWREATRASLQSCRRQEQRVRQALLSRHHENHLLATVFLVQTVLKRRLLVFVSAMLDIDNLNASMGQTKQQGNFFSGFTGRNSRKAAQVEMDRSIDVPATVGGQAPQKPRVMYGKALPRHES
eukprot:446600-Rhodomonas_salina.3